VFVLRIDQRIRKWTDAGAHVAEHQVRNVASRHPQIHPDGAASAFDDRVRESELRVELERPRLHGDGARRRPRLGQLVDDADMNAKTRQPQREDESGWAGAGDQDFGAIHFPTLPRLSCSAGL
jgi:hypothetical protein